MNHAKKMASIFGSTYTCEQLFSKMKHCKSQTRSNITDEHLNDSLRLATSKLKPNIGKLAREKQHHPSHWVLNTNINCINLQFRSQISFTSNVYVLFLFFLFSHCISYFLKCIVNKYFLYVCLYLFSWIVLSIKR